MTDWDAPRFCKACKAEHDAKWRTVRATECGHEVHVMTDWDTPRFCKACKAEHDAKWCTVRATNAATKFT